MKKFLAGLLVGLLLATSTPALASIYGQFQGYDVVKILVNGKEVQGDVPAIMFNGRTMIPLRFVGESLGAKVSWDPNTSTAFITYNTNASANSPNETEVRKRFPGAPINSAYLSVCVPTFLTDNDIKALGEMLVSKEASYYDGVHIHVEDANGQIIERITAHGKDIAALKAGKLSAAEFEARLVVWQAFSPQPLVPAIPIPNYPPPVLTPPSTHSIIESCIDGDFEGWEGETIFKLENGQIWQQDSYAYTYHYAYRPKVLIYPSGSRYKMKVEGVEGEIYVKRLK